MSREVLRKDKTFETRARSSVLRVESRRSRVSYRGLDIHDVTVTCRILQTRRPLCLGGRSMKIGELLPVYYTRASYLIKLVKAGLSHKLPCFKVFKVLKK